MKLPILTLAVAEQRYSCHGCGDCCRDFTVQLREADLAKLREQRWEERLGEPVTVEFRGVMYLRQRSDGACVFLLQDGRCRIHADHGFSEKPIACQLFPFHLTPVGGGVGMGLNFACQSVLENKGAELRSHMSELRRMAADVHELQGPSGAPKLTERLRAEQREVEAVADRIDGLLRRTDLALPTRLDGLAWVIGSLARAKLENVRGSRLADLMDVLIGALPEELKHHPVDPPSTRQLRLLRQAVFMRIEDPKLGSMQRRGWWRTRVSQLLRSRRFTSGKGTTPPIGDRWPGGIRFAEVAQVEPASDPAERARIDDVMTRWLRATVLGARCWGAGFYGWPIIEGLQALALNGACVGWLARLHAAGHGRKVIETADVRAAIGRVDRASGRAPWLGGLAERARLRYLGFDDGLRRLLDRMTPVTPIEAGTAFVQQLSGR